MIAPELELRQAADSRLVIAADFEDDAETAAHATFARAIAMVRGVGALTLDRHQVGLRPIPPDGFPIVGAVPGVPGLHVAVMHSGVTLAPAVGRHVTDVVLYGRHDALFDPYGPARFAASA